MLRSFVAWLDDYLAGEGAPAVVRAVIGLLSFAALLGTLLGSAAVKAGVIAAVLLLLLSTALLLLVDRRSIRGRQVVAQRLLTRYCRFIDELHPTYEVLSWEQSAYILNNRGDTKERVTIRARVLRDDMLLIRLVFGCGWNQPARFRRRVKVNVRNLLVGDALGTSPDVTFSWVTDGKVDVMIHFSHPPKVGSEIRFMVIMDWPGKCAPLMANLTDDFTFRFVQQSVEFVSYRIVLPAGRDAYHEPIGFAADDPDLCVDASVNEDGRSQYLFTGTGLQVRQRAGIKLELKDNGKHGSPHQWQATGALR